MKLLNLILSKLCLFLFGAVHKLGNTIKGEGVNLCVTLWADGRVKWSFWRYGGGGMGSILGQNGVT